uniref:RING-type domain-containing protein n=1 Tax=viral metagenome TaxID=1070528 RepID=A0A6C0DJJ2_9ZZZZ
MSNSLPKFFCVESMSKYRVYLNTLYRDLNILWPQENIVAGEMSIKLRTDIEKTVSYRKWNGRECKPLSWSFTGSSINMRLNDRHISIVCPIISVSDPGILPYNSCSIKPSSMIFTDILDTSNYETAVLYERDPNSSEYLTPLTRIEKVKEVVSRKGLPQHVADIVLANAISKNEICPISNDPITNEDGCVTSCGHVFSKSSLDHWLSIKNECPVCKQVCT